MTEREENIDDDNDGDADADEAYDYKEGFEPNYDFPIRKNVRHNDDVLKSRAQKEMLRLPRREFPETSKKRRRDTDEFGFIIKRKDSYLTRFRHQKEVENFRLSRTEFHKRQSYRDSDGNTYSPALESDELYRSLLQHNQVDKIDVASTSVGFPVTKDVSVVDQDGTKGELYGKVLLFSQMKPDGKLHKYPKGEIELLNPQTEQYYTGQVVTAMFQGKSKGGYVILKDVVGWGQISDPREFARKKQKEK